VNMCVLNFVMYGLRGAVIHMDTISLKIFGGYRIWLPETGLMVQPLTSEQCKAYVFEQKKREVKEPEMTYQISQYELSQTA